MLLELLPLVLKEEGKEKQQDGKYDIPLERDMFVCAMSNITIKSYRNECCGQSNAKKSRHKHDFFLLSASKVVYTIWGLTTHGLKATEVLVNRYNKCLHQTREAEFPSSYHHDVTTNNINNNSVQL